MVMYRGIKAYNPILAGQLSRDEIDSCSNDPNKKLKLIKKINQVEVKERKNQNILLYLKDKIDLMHVCGYVRMPQSSMMDKFQN